MRNCGTFVVSCNKQALLLQGNRAMPHVIFFDVSGVYSTIQNISISI